MFRRLALVAALVLAAAGAAPAQTADVSPDFRWVVVASRADARGAFDLADRYRALFEGARVFRSANGWWAIVAGAVPADEAVRILRELKRLGLVPRDAFLATGRAFRVPANAL